MAYQIARWGAWPQLFFLIVNDTVFEDKPLNRTGSCIFKQRQDFAARAQRKNPFEHSPIWAVAQNS